MTASRPEVIVIGASAGALEALSVILPALPADFPLPILLVVHIPGDKRSVLADLFRAKCRIPVIEAEDKEPVLPRTAYFAPPNYHMLLEANGTLSLSSDEPVMFSRPSIDVLFESAADALGPAALGIVLTGANHDGAKGLRAILDAGGQSIVQDPETAFQSAMPQGAIAICPEALIMPLDGIAAYLQKASCK
jgi:two-component system chemotaxis response regulator CheB